MSKKDAAMSLNVYLIKDAYDNPKDIIQKINDFAQTAITFSGSFHGTLYTQQRPGLQPKWLSIFEQNAVTLPNLANASSIAIFLVLVEKRYFALTFGHAKSYLNPDSYEEQFGLKVTLNSVPKHDMRSIDRLTFDALVRHTRTQASRRGTMLEFGLNVDQDLLRAVTGTPSTPSLGTVMSGRDSLNVTARATLSGLPGLLGEYRKKFEDETYKTTYPWIDYIAEVRSDNKAVIRKLEELLLSSLKKGGNDYGQSLWMAVPEIMDWGTIDGFNYTNSSREEVKLDLDLEEFMCSLRNREDVKIGLLQSKQIHAVSGDVSLYNWPAYKCLYYEQALDGHMYLLTAGKWYRIARDFAAQVAADVAKIDLCSNVTLPGINNETEEKYNIRVCKGDKIKYALMDRKNISHGGGHSLIEFCDLYTDSGQMIHVKRYSGSAVLSHLFQQGIVSGGLWLADKNFRHKVNRLLPKSHQLKDHEKRPRAEDHEVVFAIASKWNKPIASSLPFFSKLSLRNVARELKTYGYRVSLLHIPDLSPVVQKSK